MCLHVKVNNVFFGFVCLSIALAVTGCDKGSASPETHRVTRSPFSVGDQFNHEVQATIPTTMQIPVVTPAAPSDIEKQFRPLPKGDPFLLAATASSHVLTPLPTSAISNAQSFEEVSELIRRQVRERPDIAAGTNPFTSFLTTPRKP